MIEASHPSIRSGCSIAVALNREDKEEVVVIAEIKIANAAIYQGIAEKIYEQIHLNFGIPVYEIYLLPPKTIPKTTSGKLRRSYTKLAIEENQLPLLFKWNKAGVE